MKHFTLIYFLACLIVSVSKLSLAEDKPKIQSPTKDEISQVSNQLQNGNSNEIDSGIHQIKEWVTNNRAPSEEMLKIWFPAMLKAQKFQEIADISFQLVISGPSTSNIRDFLPFHIIALQNLNRHEQALQMSKSLYNASELKTIDKVIPLVAKSLAFCHPEDKSTERRFLMEQALSTSSSSSTKPEPMKTNMLQSVHISQEIFEKALADWKSKSETSSNEMEKYANVLLLSDQAQEAEKVFRQLIASNVRSAQTRQRYLDGIARSLKAEDGDLTRAYDLANSSKKSTADLVTP